jgi:hypothetical protein
METIADFFHSDGILPSFIDILNRIVTPLVIEGAVALSMSADIPSGPFALVVSKDSNKSSTSSSVQRNSEGHSDELALAKIS